MNQSQPANVTVYEDTEGDYTVVDSHGNIFVMNNRAGRVQGAVNQFIGRLDDPYTEWDKDAWGSEVEWSEIPENIREAIQKRLD